MNPRVTEKFWTELEELREATAVLNHGIPETMLRRHPHIFKQNKVKVQKSMVRIEKLLQYYDLSRPWNLDKEVKDFMEFLKAQGFFNIPDDPQRWVELRVLRRKTERHLWWRALLSWRRLPRYLMKLAHRQLAIYREKKRAEARLSNWKVDTCGRWGKMA